jgi:catechol 2,3-dioxygenase-like lactoylglutathione lyase family enzyme
VLPVARDPGAQRSVHFYKDVLGLKVSDYIGQEMAPGMVVEATFFHAATGRHHSLATAHAPSPKRIHYIMLEVEQMNDVGLTYDRCVAAGVPIFSGLGRHPNDRMFSFYAQTPSGFGLKFGWGGLVIDDANWEIKRYSQLSDWGHKPPAASAAGPAH